MTGPVQPAAHGAPDPPRPSDQALWAALLDGVAEGVTRPTLDRRVPIDDPCLAAAAGRHERLAELLDADPAAVSRPGGPRAWSPLAWVAAAPLGDAPVAEALPFARAARLLVERGALDGPTEDPSAVELCCEHGGSPLVLDVLLSAGAPFRAERALPLAARWRSGSLLGRLLRAGADAAGCGALAVRLRFEDPDGVDHLLAAGARPDEPAPPHGTALHAAVRHGRSRRIVARLVRAGADPDAPGELGLTPTRLAHRMGRVALFDELVALGADPDLSRLDTVLGFASRGMVQPALEVLAAHPELLTGVTDPGDPLLVDLVADGDEAGVEGLLALGAPVDGAPRGETPLHAAARRGHVHLLPTLLLSGASVDARDAAGRTPLAALALEPEREAYEEELATCARMLLGAGASFDPHLVQGARSEAVADALRRALRRRAA